MIRTKKSISLCFWEAYDLEVHFMAGLVRRTLTTLWEFMDRVDNFVNIEDMLRTLTAPRRSKLEQAEKSSKKPSDGTSLANAKKATMTGDRTEAHLLNLHT